MELVFGYTVIRYFRLVRLKKYCFTGVSVILVLIFVGLFVPFSLNSDFSKAIIDLTGDSSITMSSIRNTAAVSINPSITGSFVTTSGNSDISFSVATDNYSGYAVSVRSSKTTLDNAGSSSFLSLVSGVTADQFMNSGNTTLNNRWGYKPNYYNSAENNRYYGASTSSTLLDRTTASNSTAKNYTISLGARADSSVPNGTYINDNFIIEAVANVIPSSILTVNYGTGISSITVGGQTVPNGETVRLIQNAPYNITVTPSTSFVFNGWTASSGTISSASSLSTIYTIDSIDASLMTSATFNGPNMQNLASSGCTSTPTSVKDARDNRVYTIQRLLDGNCWMMENLDLGRTTLTTNLTPSNTNISTTIPASTFNSWKKNNTSREYSVAEFVALSGTDSTTGTAYGILYDYCAASAGTICVSENTSDASSDICPAGWRMPTGGPSGEFGTLYSYYNSYALMHAPITDNGAAFALSGLIGNLDGTPSNQGVSGLYWSSTHYDGWVFYMHTMAINSSTQTGYPNSYNTRDISAAIRCVMRNTTHTLTVSYGAHVSSVKVNGVTVQDGGTILLDEGTPYTITMTPDSKYSFLSWSATSGTIGSASSQTTTYTIGSSNATLTATGFFNGPDIQNLPSSSCTTTASYARDVRDDHIYTVQRLLDGNCWIMENLDLGSTTLTTNLTPSNTNTSTTLAASTLNSWKKTSGTASFTSGEFINVSGYDYSMSQMPYGTLYNYCAASAGTICTSQNSYNATSDICPAGWRLPTGGSTGELDALHTAYGSPSRMVASIANNGAAFSSPGLFYDGVPTGAGYGFSYYWSSTSASGNSMYDIGLDWSQIYLADTMYRSYGLAMRCIYKGSTKYSHTPNIDDSGTANGNYADNYTMNDVVSIPGASSLHVKLTYQTESTAYDWVSFWAGSRPSYTAANDYSSGIIVSATGSDGGKYGGSTRTTIEVDIPGDTVTFAFKSDVSVNNYGYYAVITAGSGGSSSNKRITDLTYLQDFKNLSSADKSSVKDSMSYNSTYNLIDNRDGKTYKVAKLNDNNIWMAENLDLGRITLSTSLTSSNTNISSSISASTFNSWKVNGISSGNYTSGEFMNASGTDSKSGTPNATLYNYYAASGGTIYGSSNSSNASYDICPAGWRLPVGDFSGDFQELLYHYQGSYMSMPIASGGAGFTLYSYWYPGNISYYWSSTRYSGSEMYGVQVDSTGFSVNYYSDRGDLFSVRCIAK